MTLCKQNIKIYMRTEEHARAHTHTHTRAHTHTHTRTQPFNGLLSGTTRGEPVPEETFTH